MPMVSIIVPIYNTAKYLDACVNSILNQTYSDFELILVDDGSIDESPSKCDKYSREDCRVSVIHKSNGGVSSARNTGMKVATGKWIWFIDSDDYIEPNSLEILSTYMNSNDLDLIVFENIDQFVVNLDDFDIFLHRFYFKYKLGFGPWNKLYRKYLLDSSFLFFDVDETIGEDLLFNFGYYEAMSKQKQSKISFIGKHIYHYVDRTGSAMNTPSWMRLFYQLRLYDKIVYNYASAISAYSKSYLFLMHLISGIQQSRAGGLNIKHFTQFNWTKYETEISGLLEVLPSFFKNEQSRPLGKARTYLFIFLMMKGFYQQAALIMGISNIHDQCFLTD